MCLGTAVQKFAQDLTDQQELLAHFASDKEESLRIRIQIADGFADHGWLVQGHRPAIEKRLPEQFQLDREGHIKKKPQAKE